MEVYANFTGFMWESAQEMDALVVFAEVRCIPLLYDEHTSCLLLLPYLVCKTCCRWCFLLPCSIATMGKVNLLVHCCFSLHQVTSVALTSAIRASDRTSRVCFLPLRVA